VWDDLLATNQEQQVDVLSPRGIRDANQQNISPQPVFAHPCVTPKKMLSSGKSPRCSQAGYRATPVWPTSARFSCGTSTSSLACSTSVLRRSISEKNSPDVPTNHPIGVIHLPRTQRGNPFDSPLDSPLSAPPSSSDEELFNHAVAVQTLGDSA
jgi:hypothetical protein